MSGGRPSSFKPEYGPQAFKIALLGATDVQLADFFGVDVATLNRWKKKHPEFAADINRGKLSADADVAKALYRRALGYSHKAVKILTVAGPRGEGASVEQVPYIEHYPPDTTACIFWLKNRQKEQWRDRQAEDNAPDDVAAIAGAIRSAVKAMDEADGIARVA